MRVAADGAEAASDAPSASLPEGPLRLTSTSFADGEPTTPDFAEGAIPAGARQMANGWQGPCPPQASPAHRYVVTLSALDVMLDLADDASAADLEAAMAGHVVGSVELVGTYERRLLPGNV